MMSLLSLILPVLIPSWRFFEAIEPSSRVQWAFTSENSDAEWHDQYRRPKKVSLKHLVVRLFWNPKRNDELFAVSCAERIQQMPTAHSIQEIKQRVRAECQKVNRTEVETSVRFRLVFVHRERTLLVENVVFTSDVFPLCEPMEC